MRKWERRTTQAESLWSCGGNEWSDIFSSLYHDCWVAFKWSTQTMIIIRSPHEELQCKLQGNLLCYMWQNWDTLLFILHQFHHIHCDTFKDTTQVKGLVTLGHLPCFLLSGWSGIPALRCCWQEPMTATCGCGRSRQETVKPSRGLHATQPAAKSCLMVRERKTKTLWLLKGKIKKLEWREALNWPCLEPDKHVCRLVSSTNKEMKPFNVFAYIIVVCLAFLFSSRQTSCGWLWGWNCTRVGFEAGKCHPCH